MGSWPFFVDCISLKRRPFQLRNNCSWRFKPWLWLWSDECVIVQQENVLRCLQCLLKFQNMKFFIFSISLLFHLFVCSFLDLFICSFVCVFVCSFVHLFVCSASLLKEVEGSKMVGTVTFSFACKFFSTALFSFFLLAWVVTLYYKNIKQNAT